MNYRELRKKQRPCSLASSLGDQEMHEDAVTDATVNIKIELLCVARKATWLNSTADSGDGP